MTGVVQITQVAKVSPEMRPRELAILERCARNTPAVSMEMGHVDTPDGKVYLAWGRGADNRWYGVWGHRNVGRLCEFGTDYSAAQVKQMLLDNAVEFNRMAGDRGLFDEGFFRGGKT